MPTTYTDQFFLLDPFSPPPVGTAMNFVSYNMIDQNDDDDFDRFDNDSVNGIDITASYPGDTVTINVSGVGNVTYTGVTFYLADGSRVFTPNDGQVLQNGTLVSTSWVSAQGPLDVVDLGPTCFVSGTMITTTNGPRKVEDLRVGDFVLTQDHGPKSVLWIGGGTWRAAGVSAPVLIKKGALGNDADMMVSQQHRMLITGWQAQLYMGVDEALVAAKYLVNGTSIRIVEGGEVEYFHLLFEAHEIITAAGIPSESYHPEHAIALDDHKSQAEIAQLFPNNPHSGAQTWEAARQVARSYEGCLMAA